MWGMVFSPCVKFRANICRRHLDLLPPRYFYSSRAVSSRFAETRFAEIRVRGWCLPDSPKPDSLKPDSLKLGFRVSVMVRVGV